MSGRQRKRRDLNIKDKLSILERYDKLPKMTQRTAAAHLKISQPLLCKILKNRKLIMCAQKENANLQCKRNRSGKDNEVESALKLWFTSVREQDTRMNGPLIRQKAEELASEMGKKEFVATEGWFNRWKRRENIDCKRTQDEQSFVDLEAAESWIENEWPKINSEFSLSNIYNVDETGLYYQALPEHIALFQDETHCGIPKEHITILCCTSMSGAKEKLVVVGTVKNPRCFNNVKNLPVEYYSNSNAWMTSLIFNDWLTKWDKKLDHQIVLLVEDSTAHNVNTFLKNIKIEFLPVDTRSIFQPFVQEIIQLMKANYRRELFCRTLDALEDSQETTRDDQAKNMSILDAMHLLAMSWNNVPTSALKNCFKLSRLVDEADGEDDTEEILPIQSVNMTETNFDAWMAIDKHIVVTAKLTEGDICGTSKKDEQAQDNEFDSTEIDYEILPPTKSAMRGALEVLRRGVQHKSEDFQKQYEYEQFINDILRKNT